MAMDADVAYLSITAVSFSTLCALFGIYFTLFGLAVWATYQKKEIPYKRLRIITIILFLDLTLHFSTQAITFARSRMIPAPAGEGRNWTIPMNVVQGLTTTTAGLLSDLLLVWRFFVIFNKRPWARWCPLILVLINTLLALSANLLPLAVYHNERLYEDKLHKTSLQILSTWGWYMFVMHTLLTGSIIWKIIHVSRPAKNLFACIWSGVPYAEVLRAIIESSFITWIGLLMYEITSFAPAGRITTDLNVGYVMACILPVFFGLAQCLITARVAYTESLKQNQSSEAPFSLTPQSSIRASKLAINVQKEVHQWTDTLKTNEKIMGRDVMHLRSFESGAC